MSANKYAQILDLLVEMTNSGKLDWKETGDESEFLVSFPNYSILIKEVDEGPGDFPYHIVSIVNSEGRIVDSFSEGGISLSDFKKDPTIVMQDLFNLARRRALKADEALDKIIADLSGSPSR